MTNPALHARFTHALDALVADIREDRSILAALLCGSLSHDAVWEHSDIDLVLVTIDDKKVDRASVSLNADGLNVHAMLLPRADFRKLAEGSVRNSFMHSLLAKGRLLYTHDESIQQMCSGLRDIGARDSLVQVFQAATTVLPSLYKAHKFFKTRGDLHYTSLWILYTATPIAQVEVMRARLIADREVIPQAMKLNPELFRVIYTGMLDGERTHEQVADALAVIDAYMAERASDLFAPLLDYLRETGEARSVSELDAHFARHFGVDHASMACEYLADRGLLAKVSITRQLTRRSNVSVQELAFVHLGAPSHA
ncbi:MAG: hypothetical protein H7Z40_10390 [Phycisphaerae bacterium]|nr:hypothetical protein [Gemmatimonadaceae bacterium]